MSLFIIGTVVARTLRLWRDKRRGRSVDPLRDKGETFPSVQVFLSGLLTTIGQFLLFPVPFSFKFVVFLLDLSFQSFAD
jgi:hypothetical protein